MKRTEPEQSIAEKEAALQNYLVHDVEAKTMTPELFFETITRLREMEVLGVISVDVLKSLNKPLRLAMKRSAQFLNTPDQWLSYFGRVLAPLMAQQVDLYQSYAEGPYPYFNTMKDLERAQKGERPRNWTDRQWAHELENLEMWKMIRRGERPDGLSEQEWTWIMSRMEEAPPAKVFHTRKEITDFLVEEWDQIVQAEHVVEQGKFIWLFMAFLFVHLQRIHRKEEGPQFPDDRRSVINLYRGNYRLEIFIYDYYMSRFQTPGMLQVVNILAYDVRDVQGVRLRLRNMPTDLKLWLKAHHFQFGGAFTDVILLKDDETPLAVAFLYRALSQGWRFDKKAASEIMPKELKSPICAQCGSMPSNLKTCGRCFEVAYCGVDCQRAHWKAGHKKECK